MSNIDLDALNALNIRKKKLEKDEQNLTNSSDFNFAKELSKCTFDAYKSAITDMRLSAINAIHYELEQINQQINDKLNAK